MLASSDAQAPAGSVSGPASGNLAMGAPAAGSVTYICDATVPKRADRSVQDVVGGFRRWRLAAALARLDIRNRYRGSVIGPLWLTLSTAVMVFALGLLYSTLFKMPISNYLPYLAVSLIVWNMLSQIVSEACTSLISSEGIIRQVTLPYTVHVLRCVFRNIVVAAHSLPLIAVVFLICRVNPGWGALMALPGFVIVVLNTFAVAMFLGMICARFRDIPQIVQNVMQLAFYMSPIMWKPEQLGNAARWLPLNPFYSILEVMRGPLLEGGTSGMIWLAAGLFTILTCTVSMGFFVRFRGRIAFWV